jgi:hypothetical protein
MATAPGIPNREDLGDTSRIPLNKLLTYVDQLHRARRAGTHHDIRFGDQALYSWTTRKGLPVPGEKRTLFQQPLHSPEYASFQGEIPEGYGAGTVKTHERGEVLVSHASKDKIKFVVAHRKYPEYFTLVRSKNPDKPKEWLLINHTPSDPAKALGSKDLFSKVHIRAVDPSQAERVIDGVTEGKIDGASGLFHLKENSMDVMSYRVGKNGRPIMHTERFFGGSAPELKIPKNLVGRVARGEIYGVDKDGKPLGSQGTSPLLNMSLSRSLRTQEAEGKQLRGALFGFADRPANYPEREEELASLLEVLPKDRFGRPPVARGKAEGLALLASIGRGEHPETDEGVVNYPEKGDPVKIKFRPEQDVQISGVFPGDGKYKGSAGGITYRTEKGEGRVGTGFDDNFRRWLWENRDAVRGRIARITSAKELPSGKHFQPSFIGLHEDYPTKTAALGAGGSLKLISKDTRAALLKSVRRKLEKLTPEHRIAVRTVFGTSPTVSKALARQKVDPGNPWGLPERLLKPEYARFLKPPKPADPPKVIAMGGKPTLLHYRAAQELDKLKNPVNAVSSEEGVEKIFNKHITGIPGDAISTTVDKKQTLGILAGIDNKERVLGVYATPLEELLRNQRLRQKAMLVNKAYPSEREITQLKGDNLIKAIPYKRIWNPNEAVGEEMTLVRRRENTPATKKLPSGRFYQPSFVGLHEDYPTKTAGINEDFQPDFTPHELKEMGVYGEVYGPRTAPRLASLPEWPSHWYHPEDPHGWLQWYKRYSEGRRMEDDERQIKRWRAFKARHGGPAFQNNPTPRRAYALRNWAIDPKKLVADPESLEKMMASYRAKKYNV